MFLTNIDFIIFNCGLLHKRKLQISATETNKSKFEFTSTVPLSQIFTVEKDQIYKPLFDDCKYAK